jgi:hypothetical protein
MEITDVQQARAIVRTVGEPYQAKVIDMLQSLTYDHSSDKYERNAQKVITNMEHEYVLNVANVLWADKFEEIPQYIKGYSGGTR